MQELHAGVRPGTTVHARGATWTIIDVRRFEGCAFVSLEPAGPARAGRRTTLISPFDDITAAPRERLLERPRARVAGAVLGAIGCERPPRVLWAAAAGRFTPLAWQLAPALAVLGGATRVLLADAVGLGKTVQAGVILAELMARGLVERALVLTPAGLRDDWVEELRARFGLAAEALHPASLADGAWRTAGANPWMRAPVVVSSIDLVKRPEVRAAVDDQPLDLLIVDEAHHCTPGSDRGAVVARLARAVPWLVLASATPHAGDPRAFRFLLDLGRAGPDEPAMRVFRRSRRAAGLAGRRSTHVLAVVPTPAEQRLQEAVRAYARDLCEGPRGGAPGLRLVCAVLARRATSSALAARRTLARRLAALTGRPAAPAERQPLLPWWEVEDEEGLDPSWLGTPGLLGTADECARLRRLIAHADEACAEPSKPGRLRRLLARAGEPAIVFTEFRDSIEACLPFVQDVMPTRCLHGAMDVRDRRRAVDDFRRGRARLLLATDVAGEGLNLHERARLVITLEWPWSPQRLEQRVGRVDRLGQARRVHAVHLTTRGTFEDTVVARLMERARAASEDLGRWEGQVIGERAIEAAVLGGTSHGQAADAPPPPPRAEAAAADEVCRVLERRRLVAHARPGAPLPAWCLPSGCGQVRAGAGLAVVFEVTDRSGPGRLDACAVVAIEVALARAPAHRREWRDACRAAARDSRVRAAALAAVPAAPVGADAPWRDVVARLRAIRGQLDATPPATVQASLFDRRAVRDALAREAVTARLHAHLERKARDLAAPGGVRDARVLALIPLA
ncbi:MAG: DEAD/DEAH box helicase [Acidobacteria bacterium]|nr:DEAD/DEAH box helicase [Acidobacteriota bacterium]